MKRRVPILLAAAAGLVVLLASPAGASPDTSGWKLPVEQNDLRPGPGRAAVLGQCLLCHSSDYITTQPPLDRAGWQASVDKMRSRFGAPIPTNVVPVLVEYLATRYGPTAPGGPSE